MKRSYFRRAGGSMLGLVLAAGLGSSVYLGCSKNAPLSVEKDPTQSYTVEGYVSDGATGARLAGAVIRYKNARDVDDSVVTDAQGGYSISGNPAGSNAFSYSFGGGSVAYTTATFTATSTSPGPGERIPGVSTNIMLYPLSGSVRGNIQARVHELSSRANVSGVTVRATYGAALDNSFPYTFSAITDSVGNFVLVGLPVEQTSSLTIQVLQASVGALDWNGPAPITPSLVPGDTVNLGILQMTPVMAASFNYLSNNFPSNNVTPNGSMQLTYSEALDSMASSAFLQASGGSQNVPVTIAFSNQMMTITPSISLVNGSSYRLTANAYGAMGGSDVSRTFTLTAVGGGLADVSTSNILDGNKVPKNGLGLSSPVNFVFRDSIVSAQATVTLAGAAQVVTTAVSNRTLTISPNGTWKPGTYTIAVNATLASGAPVTFTTTAATVGAFALAESNVINAATSAAINGLGAEETIFLRMNKGVQANPKISLTQGGSSIPVTVTVSGDTVRVDPLSSLLAGSNHTLTVTFSTADGEIYSNSVTFATKASDLRVIASNVLTSEYTGIRNADVEITPYYVLSVTPDPSTIRVTFAGGGPTTSTVSVRGDTIFAVPPFNFSNSANITATITGKSTDGRDINLTLNGSQIFTTAAAMAVVATNMWDESGNPNARFTIYDTIWAVYSESLSTQINQYDWNNAGTVHDIRAGGSTPNATAWVNGDTLFVMPDPSRIALTYGSTMGIDPDVVTAKGRKVSLPSLTATIEPSPLFVQWTNTKDNLGQTRTDFGLTDTVIVVSSQRILEVRQVTGGDLGGIDPSDLNLDNVRLSASGDTIWFVPSVRLAAGTTYDIDFDVKLANGTIQTGVLDVVWETASGVRIASVSNRSGGLFRPFKTYGDSLVVTFSKAIDTSKGALTPFAVTNFVTDYTVSWSANLMTATIKNMDSLRLADFGANNAYTNTANAVGANGTRAYDDLTFSVTTADGETATLGAGTNIDIHTEYGLFLVDANFFKEHDLTKQATAGAAVTDTFPVAGNITLTFNRAVDTALIKLSPQNYFALYRSTGTIALDYSLTFSADAKTVTLNPVSDLEKGGMYYAALRNVPGEGIRFAANSSGLAVGLGANTGALSNGITYIRAVTNAFTVKDDPKAVITALAVTIAKDTTVNHASQKIDKASGAMVTRYDGLIATPNENDALHILVTESAWNENHADSVGGYQVQARRVTRAGVAGDWFLSSTLVTTAAYATGFNSATTNATNSQIERTLDLSGQGFYSALRTADGDGAGGDYTNGNDFWNDSARIEIRLRPVIDHNVNGLYETGEFGTWSNALAFVDNVAPLDTNFVARAANLANLNSIVNGGVSISAPDIRNAANGVMANTNFSGETNPGTWTLTLTFPEDMDTSTAASISLYKDDNTAAGTLTSSASSGWTSARTYDLVVTVAAGTDYTVAPNLRYWRVSVAGMKDQSGNAIQSWGSIGTAGDNVALGAVTGEVAGSANLGSLTRF